MDDGPYDVTLVEGSVSSPEQLEQLRSIRERSRFLMTIGACATSGGVQALRNGRDIDEYVRSVYASPEFIDTLADSTPIAEHVKVDLELTGCPVDRGQLLAALAWLIQGSVPRPPTTPVCIECKRRGYVCVMVAKGEPCLGPVTRTGCGALCPGMGRGCYGCFGPSQPPNTEALARTLPRSRDAADAGRRHVPVHHRLRAGLPRGRGSPRTGGGRAMTHRSVEVPGRRARGGRGRAARPHRRRRDRRARAADLRAAALLRGVPARAATSARCPTSFRGSAASARSPIR